jgi:2-polyprenyl-6-methoxyphenol hydroxylase-like FAD-dependent oxidoreductase
MNAIKHKTVLISGASIAGLTTAWLMNQQGYNVTIVELASGLRVNGTPVNIEDEALDVVRQMGIFEQLKANRLNVERIEYKNADDTTDNSIVLHGEEEEIPDDNFEIERSVLLNILHDSIKNDVEFLFDNRITALTEDNDAVQITFKTGLARSFNLVMGCDGAHSNVRRLWFGAEKEYACYLGVYFSITTVEQLLIRENTLQFYNVPDKGIMLNTYHGKTDIIFYFFSEQEISYDYRDIDQQKKFILEQFEGGDWRTDELLAEVQRSDQMYFDKLCQIKMPSWTKERVGLVGDAAYCASPAAGKGGSLAMIGAKTMVDALSKGNEDYAVAFRDYDRILRPFVEKVQAEAMENVTKFLIPRTQEAIRSRNKGGFYNIE